MHVRSIAVLLLVAVALVPGVLAETHPFSIHDMLAMDRISDPQVSPDGRTVVFVVRTTDLEANRGRTDLWLVGADGAGLRRLTAHPDSDTNPRFTPDGREVLFLSTRGGSGQVWRIPLGGGEAVAVTELPLDVGGFAVSPDGKRLAVAVEVFPDCDTLDCSKTRLDEIEKKKASGRIYDKLFVRHWDTWKDGRRSHVVVVPATGGGKPVDVMRGMDVDSPSKPFGGPEEFTFTPDSREIVFTARDAGREEAWSTNFDLYRVPVDGSAKPRSLTEKNKAWDTMPVFSPDGKTLAYLAMEQPGYESDRFRIVLRGWPNGEARALTESWDRSPGTLAWSADSKALYVTANNVGHQSLFAIDAASGSAKTLVERGTVRAALASDGGRRIVYTADDLRGPTEIYSARPDGSDVKQLTRINADKVAAARMGEFEQFTFPGWKGERVHAFLVKPVGFDAKKKWPVAFLIHGGPQGSFGNEFHYRWNPQAYAGAGYAAVMVDFHGSTGYGQAFTDSIRGDWGGKPFEDLQKGLAAALERYPFLDGERVCALGASYGGYMINWIAGNWPGRFRCLVNHDGNLDERMAYYDTEELWFPEWDHEGTPWEHPEHYTRHNPIDHVAKWDTPMLVIHGALDYRVVDTQGLSTFNALQRRGIPSRLLYFPDENHWVLKPQNSILWHETVLGWLDQWAKKE
jgi:dipeptidyl aminopeptidase/acylaminoacyl peptidase